MFGVVWTVKEKFTIVKLVFVLVEISFQLVTWMINKTRNNFSSVKKSEHFLCNSKKEPLCTTKNIAALHVCRSCESGLLRGMQWCDNMLWSTNFNATEYSWEDKLRHIPLQSSSVTILVLHKHITTYFFSALRECTNEILTIPMTIEHPSWLTVIFNLEILSHPNKLFAPTIKRWKILTEINRVYIRKQMLRLARHRQSQDEVFESM